MSSMSSPRTVSRQPLTIAVAQPQIELGDVVANAAVHAAVVVEADARVVVFPELSLTGYSIGAEPIEPTDDRLAPIVSACETSGSIAIVGAPVAGRNDDVFIAILVVDGAGASVAYRKIWLGGAEPTRFTAGREPSVVDVDGWRLGLAICKDTRIAEHAEAVAALGIDAYIGGICESADAHAEPERRARVVADRFGVWVALASFAGPTGGGFDATAGRSGVWRPDGSAAVQLDQTPDRIGRAEIERADLTRVASRSR
jgi:predicted amidohydrolase